MKTVPLWVVLVFVCAAGCGKGKGAEADQGDEAKPAVSVQLVKAAARPMKKTVSFPGSFVPAQGNVAKLTPAIAGRISKVLVKEGDPVRAGEILATLDISLQAAQQSSAELAATAARDQALQSQLSYKAAVVEQSANVIAAQNALDQAQMQRDNDVTQAELAYEAARADLQKTRAGARPQEIAQAHEATVQAQATRDRAAVEYRRDQSLWADGNVSRRQLDDAKTALDTASSALTAAEASESLVRAGARPEDLRSAEVHTAASWNALESAKALGAKRVSAAEAGLRQARAAELAVDAKRQEAQSNAALAKQKVSDAQAATASKELGVIRAPFDGRVTRRALDGGDAADTTTTVLEVSRGSGSADFVCGCLPNQAASIRPGQAAQIETSAGGEKIEGRVIDVTSADPQSGLCSIRIACRNAPAPGTYGNADIVVATLGQTVAVPDAALITRDGKTEVLRAIDGAAKETEVEAGPEDGGFTAILSGLKSGEEVIASGGNEIDDGTKITVAAKGDDKESGS